MANGVSRPDLSLCHEPVTDLFPRGTGAFDCRRYRLSTEQVAFFHENGYLSGLPMLDERQLRALRSELAAVVELQEPDLGLLYEYNRNESADPATRLFHCLGHWRVFPGLHDLLWNPAFTVPASQLLGGAVRFWHDQLFYKPARQGGVVAWHQDFSYWTRTRPMAHLTVWIALDDATRENGCVHFVPGSHRWELLPKPALAGDMDAIRSVLTPQQRSAFQPVANTLRAGQASFHHPLMLHGSYENRTEGPRGAVVVNVVRDGVRSATDEPLLAGVPAIPKGEPLAGRFFPLLFSPPAGLAASA
jgi:ectoine hydroxylase-related dioxygenase (phytanoyl-CoA dioxygenase family)